MGPKRKKLDTNTQQVVDGTDEGNVTNTPTKPSSAPSRSSWSWRSKASPIAQLAKESISVAQGATSSSSESPNRPPPSSVSKSVRGSRKSIPLAAEATRVHATSDVGRSPKSSSEEKLNGIGGDGKSEDETKEVVVEGAPLPPEPTAMEDVLADGKSAVSTQPRNESWFWWWSKPDDYASDGEKRSKKQKLDLDGEVASNTPLPGTPAVELADPGLENARQFEGIADASKQDEKMQMGESTAKHSSGFWFGLRSGAQNQQAAADEQTKKVGISDPPEITVSPELPTEEETAKNTEPSRPDTKAGTDEIPKSAAWAFWSSHRPRDAAPTPGGTRKQVGELAVADTPSQSRPEAAQFNEQREEPTPAQIPLPKKPGPSLRPKRGRSKESSSSTAAAATDLSTASTSVVNQPSTPAETPPQSESEAPKSIPGGKQIRPNLILPLFRNSFPPAPNPGYMERLTQYLAQSLNLPGSQPSAATQHVYIDPSPPKIRKAVALGVHGFFPGALIQKLIGQPTGTSIRFANYAATAIKTWCAEHQPDVKDVEVEKVALEGEGYIADRVTTLWSLLLNWLSHLRKANFIIVACHSQGVPVAVMLVAKLIQLGCLSPNTRLGICAMAGINLGPFLEYKSRLFSGAALELFEFCDSESRVSRSYAESLAICLRHGVRVTFVGSIDDQLVSLESSLHAPLSHPYVSRAVFIDGRLHAPNFLTHLVVFALKMRNLGLSDHGLIREMSVPLAGSLVGGEGHSRVYDDPAVYRLAVEFAMESTNVQAAFPPFSSAAAAIQNERNKTTAVHRASQDNIAAASALANVSLTATTTQLTGITPTIAAYEPLPSSANTNPFYLPWSVRGMLEEDLVKKDAQMKEEVAQLVREFEAWKPTSKVLRDVRWRLEGVKNML